MKKYRTQLSSEQKQQVYKIISEGSEPKISFYILVILSTIIASYGLIANSTAVVIGAMIVAPLMTPILGISLSLVSGDSQLFKLAVIAEVAGVLCSIALGFVAGKVTFGVELSAEILARTQPLPYDLLVALAAGLAGAYSLVNPKINAALAGVAIAVSLVPPLAATGICLALAHYDFALGAFLLFFANFLAIQLAGVSVFILSGFIDYLHEAENKLLFSMETKPFTSVAVLIKRFIPSVLLLVLIAWHLSQTLYFLVQEKQFKNELESIIREEVQKRTGARLTEVNYKKEQDKINSIAVVMTPQEFLSVDIEKIQQHVRAHLGDNINLIVRSIISKDADAAGDIFLLDDEKLKRKSQSEDALFLNNVTKLLNQALNDILGAYLDEIRREDNEDIKTIIAVVRTPVAIKPVQVQMMQTLLQTFDKRIRLVVRSVLTQDADAVRYLYQTTDVSLNQNELALHKKMENALKNIIKRVAKGGVLLDFQYTVMDDSIDVLAVVQTPQNFSSKQVKLIQSRLQDDVDNRIKLVVRSVVGIDMDESGTVVTE